MLLLTNLYDISIFVIGIYIKICQKILITTPDRILSACPTILLLLQDYACRLGQIEFSIYFTNSRNKMIELYLKFYIRASLR